MPTRRLAILLLLAASWLTFDARAGAARDGIVVFAAASLTDALGEVARNYQQDTGQTVRLLFASSAILARQIQSGAGADLYFAADSAWMDYVVEHDLVVPGSRTELLTNTLVLVAPSDSTLALKLVPGVALKAALGSGRLATGDPDSVPVGRYARAALATLGVWNGIEDRLVRAEDVRSALAFVARGEAPLGIVYATDARAEPRVRVVDTFPLSSHPPIRYAVALTRNAAPAAGAFLTYLRGASAAQTFRKYGFGVAEPNAR